MKQTVKVMLTGGHVTPALAVIDELKRQQRPWEIVFVGRRYPLEGSRVEGEEYHLVTAQDIRFIPMTSGRLTRSLGLSTVSACLKIPIGFAQAFLLLLRERPKVIVSFGGYIALPVVIAGWLLGIPSLTHEQTRVPGLANRVIGSFARRICVSFADRVVKFPKNKTVYTGLPLRRVVFSPPAKAPFRVHFDLPLLFFTGGATGAQTLNEIIFTTLPDILSAFSVVHQVGRLSGEKAQALKLALPESLRSRYIPLPYLDAPAYSWVLHRADLVVSRAGANTVGELAAVGKIALLIPLPWSAGGEQHENARWLTQYGGARVVEQKALTPKTLLAAIKNMMEVRQSLATRAQKFSASILRDGARNVVAEITSIVGYHL